MKRLLRMLRRRNKVDIASALSNHGDELRAKPNVVGWSAASQKRIKGGVEVEEEVIRVYVTRKDLHLADASWAVPLTLDGIPTDVVEIGRMQPLGMPDPRLGKHDFLQGGISVGCERATGTLGGFVVGQNGQVYILSNAHVLAPLWDGVRINDPVFQSGPADWEATRDPSFYRVGELIDYVAIIPFVGSENSVDAALASVEREYLFDGLMELPQHSGNPVDPVVGMAVVKEGRTSGVTRGVILDNDATLTLTYGSGETTFQATFIHQVLFGSLDGVRPVEPGDSGSLLLVGVDPVGLVFAGSETHGAANSIKDVLDMLGVSITRPGTLPEPEEPPTPSVRYSGSEAAAEVTVIEPFLESAIMATIPSLEVETGKNVTVSGRLVDKATGAGLPNRMVSLWWVGMQRDIHATMTGNLGLFQFVVPIHQPPGVVLLNLVFDGDLDT